MEPLRPPVQWAQRRDKLMISVYLTDIHNEKFTLDETKLTFSGIGGDGSNYAFELELYKEVIPQESKHKKTGRELFFSIKKKEDSGYWPRLHKEARKVPFIKVDFNRWKDEDDSDDDDDQFEDGLENLMHKMDMGGAGNGGKFDPGDLPDTDSDDEEMPDLEP